MHNCQAAEDVTSRGCVLKPCNFRRANLTESLALKGTLQKQDPDLLHVTTYKSCCHPRAWICLRRADGKLFDSRRLGLREVRQRDRRVGVSI